MKFSQLVEHKLRLLEQGDMPLNTPPQQPPMQQSPDQAVAGDAAAAINTPAEEDLEGEKESTAREEEKVKLLTIVVDLLTPIITLSISAEDPALKSLRDTLTTIKDIASKAIIPADGNEITLASALSEIENIIKTDYGM